MEVVKHLKRNLLSLSRTLDRGVLPLRFFLRKRRPHPKNILCVGAKSESIPVHVINLATRPDRLRETQDEFRKMGILRWTRFEAVKSDNGSLGCALSHARLLESIDGSELAVMVCEDDIEFLVSPQELDALMAEFLASPAIDVLCLAFNVGSKPHPISSRLAITANTQTTACYVVKGRAREMLTVSFFESAGLIQQGKPLGIAAVDRHWKKLQRRTLLFAVPRVRAARQRPSFSDIEEQKVSYGV
jgi:hypothetical protein